MSVDSVVMDHQRQPDWGHRSPGGNLKEVAFHLGLASRALLRLQNQANTRAQRIALQPLRGCIDAAVALARLLPETFR